MREQLMTVMCLATVVLFASCGGGRKELSREDALEALEKHAQESPWTGEVKLDGKASSRDPNFNFKSAAHDPYGRTSYMMGVVAIGENYSLRDRVERGGYVHEIWGYDLKESAKPFVIQEKGGPSPDGYKLRSVEVTIGQRNPSEIIRMTEPAPRMDGVTVSQVTFQWSWDLNRDIYHAYAFGNPYERVEDGLGEGKATFVLYDQGWLPEEVRFSKAEKSPQPASEPAPVAAQEAAGIGQELDEKAAKVKAPQRSAAIESAGTKLRPTEAEIEPEQGEPIHVGGDVKKPEKLHTPQPSYTEEAREAGIQGVVITQCIIDRSGRVRQVKILKGLPNGLSEKAASTIKEWRFKPATLDGKPVEVYYNLTVHFRLD